MGIAERREREKEALRTRIVEAARDIVSEEGLDALSMRALAERIEYSPATIYLYFRDKHDLLREVVGEGFRRLGEYSAAQVAEVGPEASAAERHRAMGRAYARFALENTAYFRVMFELPSVPRAQSLRDAPPGAAPPHPPEHSWCALVDSVRASMLAGSLRVDDAEQGAIISWGLIHGLTSLYLSGHLARSVPDPESFLALVERAMTLMRQGWGTPAGE
jgi:AcrR family transcriptional regulator